jgi:hypothetical protein
MRTNPGAFVREVATRSTEAALDFVGYEQSVHLSGELTGKLPEPGIKPKNATFAQYRLNDNPRCPFRYGA